MSPLPGGKSCARGRDRLLLQRAPDDDPALGALLHLPRDPWLGATIDRDQTVAFLLSVDLFKLFQSDAQIRRAMTGTLLQRSD